MWIFYLYFFSFWTSVVSLIILMQGEPKKKKTAIVFTWQEPPENYFGYLYFLISKACFIHLTEHEKRMWIQLFAGEVMTSFNHAGYRHEHEHDELDSCVYLVCVFYQWQRYSSSVVNYDQHLSLYYGFVNRNLRQDLDISSCENLVS